MDDNITAVAFGTTTLARERAGLFAIMITVLARNDYKLPHCQAHYDKVMNDMQEAAKWVVQKAADKHKTCQGIGIMERNEMRAPMRKRSRLS